MNYRIIHHSDNDSLKHYGVLGMKWGVRRYQNADGSLTAAGQERYSRDKRENAAKKKENRIDVSEPDPNRWVKEDLNRSKRVVDTSQNLTKQVEQIASKNKSNKKVENIDQLSDKEMRDKINRYLLEKQYTDIFGEETTKRGAEYVKAILQTAGTTLAIVGSGLSIALAVKDLKD